MSKKLLITFYLVKNGDSKYHFLATTEDGKKHYFGHNCLEKKVGLNISVAMICENLKFELIGVIESIFESYKKDNKCTQFLYQLEFNKTYTQIGVAVSREKISKDDNFFIPQVSNIIPLQDDHIEFIQNILAYDPYFNQYK